MQCPWISINQLFKTSARFADGKSSPGKKSGYNSCEIQYFNSYFRRHMYDFRRLETESIFCQLSWNSVRLQEIPRVASLWHDFTYSYHEILNDWTERALKYGAIHHFQRPVRDQLITGAQSLLQTYRDSSSIEWVNFSKKLIYARLAYVSPVYYFPACLNLQSFSKCTVIICTASFKFKQPGRTVQQVSVLILIVKVPSSLSLQGNQPNIWTFLVFFLSTRRQILAY